ncbi:unnamed protein product [Durusdinium trenchii]|uniref:peptidylprolyl isomerase n=1 Tax=Durusdinium trenchii TaxID=1381693 RepID=A0ABP0HEI5_9DINO
MALAASSGRLGVDASLELSSDEETGLRLPWGIRKRLLHKGTGPERPISGDEVKVHLQGKLQDGTSITSSEEPFSFIIDERPREVIQGLELGVQTMTKGEVAEFTIAPRFAYDDLGAPPLVPPDATLIFEVELLDWENKSDVLGDGRAIKTVTERGSGKRKPEMGQDVELSLKVTSRKGIILHEHRQMEHTVGEPDFGQISPILVEVLRSMSEGERCNVLLRRFAGDKVVDNAHSGANIDITLMRIFETTDISPEKDGSLLKKCLVTGSGAPPRAFDQVCLRIVQVTDGNGKMRKALSDGGQVLNFGLGEGHVSDALDFAAASMVVGEEAKLICKAPLHFAEAQLGLDASLEKAIIHASLLSVSPGPNLEELKDEDLVNAAEGLKDKAGALFKSQRFALALQVYTRLCSSLDGKQQSKVQKIQRLCELNQAACFLKLGKPQQAKQSCDRVLEHKGAEPERPQQLKALYRRATAAFQLSDFEGSMRDLVELLKLQPSNSEARALAEQVRGAQQGYAKEAKAAAARMFGANQAASEQVVEQVSLLQRLLPCLPCPSWERENKSAL